MLSNSVLVIEVIVNSPFEYIHICACVYFYQNKLYSFILFYFLEYLSVSCFGHHFDPDLFYFIFFQK